MQPKSPRPAAGRRSPAKSQSTTRPARPPAERLSQDARTATLALVAEARAQDPADADAALAVIARRCAELLGDACIVSLISAPGGHLLPVAAHHPSPAAQSLLHDLLGGAWLDLHAPWATPVLQSGQPLLLPGTPGESLLAEGAPDAGLYGERVGIRSVLIVPILVRGQPRGTLTLLRDRSGAPYTTGDQLAVQEVAYHAALIVETARLYQESEEAARRQNDSQMLLDAVFASALDALVILDGRLHIVEANPAACALVGAPKGDFRTRNALEFVPPRRRMEAHDLAQELFAEGALSSEFEIQRHDGEIRLVEFRARAHIRPGYHLVAFRDVTERRRAEESRLAREAAEEANRAKSEFLSRMSHELRTPLHAILGFAQVLEMEPILPAQEESLKSILRAGWQLLELVDEVLDIARIEAGRMSLSQEPVPLLPLLFQALDLVRPLAQRRAVKLPAQLPALCDTHVLADHKRLQQVVLNLLTNAVKYNRVGGTVEIGCLEPQPGWLRVSVVDTGHGLPPEMMQRLFTPFDRLGAEQSTTEGTGLGLVLSRHLLEAMGGTIGVESRPGSGSTFWFELPIVDSPLARLDPEPPAVAPQHLPTEPRTVLYIEDNLSNLKLIERILERRPAIKLLAAMQGRLGLELARTQRPDAILLDLHLPDMTGEEVLRALREDPDTAAIPVLVVSADAMPRQITLLLARGAHAYLTKPLDAKELLRLLDAVLYP